MPTESGKITLDDIADLVGWDAAATLSAQFGGTSLYLAKTPPSGSQIVLAIGLDLARKIGDSFGGEYLSVPLRIGRRARILALRRKGKSHSQIALDVGVSVRTVERALAAADAPSIEDQGRGRLSDPNQLDMFA
jgi:hypothetical protein